MLKRRTFKRFFSVCVSVIVLTCMLIYIYIQNQNYKSQKKLLNLADNIINENIVNFNSKEISQKEEYEEKESMLLKLAVTYKLIEAFTTLSKSMFSLYPFKASISISLFILS